MGARCTKSSFDYRHPPVCRNYKSGNRCMEVIACFDMLMGRRNPATNRKMCTHGAVAILKEKQVQGCVSHKADPTKSILRKAGQTRLNVSVGHATKFSGRTEYEVTVSRRHPIRRTSWATSLRVEFWGKNTWGGFTTRRFFMFQGWGQCYVLFSCENEGTCAGLQTQKSVCLRLIRELQCTMLSEEELSSDEVDTLRRSQNPLATYTQRWDGRRGSNARHSELVPWPFWLKVFSLKQVGPLLLNFCDDPWGLNSPERDGCGCCAATAATAYELMYSIDHGVVTNWTDMKKSCITRCTTNIMNYSSSLRTKWENFDNVGFEFSKPAVVNHEQGSQCSNNVKTKAEPSSVHQETGVSPIRVAPASSKSSSGGSGGSSYPTFINPKWKSISVKKEIPNEDWICNSWMPEMQEGLAWDSHLQGCHKYGSTPRWTRNRWSKALELCTVSIETDSRTRTGWIVLFWKHQDKVWKLARRRWRIKICSCDPRSIRWKWSYQEDWWISWWFITNGSDLIIAWVEYETNIL